VLDFAGEFTALGRSRVIKSFYAFVGGVGVPVKVDADKNEVAFAVGDCRALIEGNIGVGFAREHRGDSFGFQNTLNAFGEIKSEVFFVNAIPVGAFVVSSMSGVDHNGGKIMRIYLLR